MLFFLQDCEPVPDPLSAMSAAIPNGPPQVNTQPHSIASAVVAVPTIPEQQPRQGRPEFTPEEAETPPWLDAFRLQVSARSPGLAACFVGVNGPGRLQWTTSVSPSVGHVSDHELQPLGSTEELSSLQRTCMLGVLSGPNYTLRVPDGSGAPARVRLLIAY